MIFKIEQLRTGFNMVWMATKGENTLCTAIVPFEKGRINITVDYSNGEQHRLYYNPSDTSNSSSLIDRMKFRLYSQDELLGSIEGINKKEKGFLQSYTYRFLKIGSDEYFLYEVGFGNKGLYLCIYRGDELIAIVEKALLVKDYQDSYEVYTTSSENIAVIVPLILHYDITAHSDMMEVSLASVKRKKVNTIQKELLKKFDDKFIEKVKAME